MKGQLGNG